MDSLNAQPSCGASSPAACLLLLASCSLSTVPTASSIVRALQVDDARIRGAAIQDAARLGPTGIPGIGALLSQKDPIVVEAARRALCGIARQSSGSAADREVCAAALLALLDPEQDARTRFSLFRMLSLVANDAASITEIGGFLDDPAMAGGALFALERIGHSWAESILIDRLSTGSALPRVAYIRALGARESSKAVSSLLPLATRSESAEAARAALARIADPRAEAVLENAPDESRRHWLRYLDRRLEIHLEAPVDDEAKLLRTKLVSHYSQLSRAAKPELRTAALVALRRLHGAQVFDPIFQRLGDEDPRVASTARAALESLQMEGIAERLVDALSTAPTPVHSAILRVLTERKESPALDLVRDAAGDPRSPVYLTALELAADFDATDLEPYLVDACKSDDAEVRDVAAASLHRHALHRLSSGERTTALALFHRVLRAGVQQSLLRSTLASIGEIASPSSISHLEAIQDPALREDVLRARLAIARGLGDPSRAVPMLQSIYLAASSRSTRRRASARLEELEVDTSSLVRQAGFLTDWSLLGPVAKASEKDLASHPFGPRGPDPGGRQRTGEQSFAWQPGRKADPDGIVNLASLKPNRDAAVYALCELSWPKAQDLILRIGSDDGVAVWLNGVLVHENFVWRGIRTDQDSVPVRLRAGPNRILLKVNQGGGDWGFCVRLCEQDGKPVDLR
ncbi:MAG: hypothetical protein ACE5F1_08595 [Planctomycetota bacterium]